MGFSLKRNAEREGGGGFGGDATRAKLGRAEGRRGKVTDVSPTDACVCVFVCVCVGGGKRQGSQRLTNTSACVFKSENACFQVFKKY